MNLGLSLYCLIHNYIHAYFLSYLNLWGKLWCLIVGHMRLCVETVDVLLLIVGGDSQTRS